MWRPWERGLGGMKANSKYEAVKECISQEEIKLASLAGEPQRGTLDYLANFQFRNIVTWFRHHFWQKAYKVALI